MKNYYEILQVNKNASKEIIKNAYKILSQEQTVTEEEKKDLDEAYHVLSDDFLREQYNKEYQNENVANTETNKSKKVDDEKNREKKKNKKIKEKKINNNNQVEKERKAHKLGSIMSLFDIIKDIFIIIKNGNYKQNANNWNKKDTIALLSAIIIVILIGVILWFLPFTHELIENFIFLRK